MKKILLITGILAVTFSAFAQDDETKQQNGDEIQTLMGKNRSVGGYGALSIQYTEIENRDAFVFGARGGIVLGHFMSLGLGGSGFFNDAQDVNGEDYSLAGGYGGFFFEPVIMSKFPVHVAFPVLIGAGGVSLMNVDDEDEVWDDNYDSEASDAFMVIEPGLEVELNVTRFFRFCVGAYYRYTSDVDFNDVETYSVPSDVLRGFSGGVTFKFGRF